MEHWIYRAKQYALSHAEGPFRHCAIALDKSGGLLAIESNSFKSHPIQHYYSQKVLNQSKAYLHAEIRALIKARSQVHTLIVVRVNKAGRLRLSKPCAVCQAAIADAQVSKVFYSTGASHDCKCSVLW